MADWFWKRKSKEQIVVPVEEASFTSYLDKEDNEGFVHITKPQQPKPLTPVERSDYETLYQFMNMSMDRRNTSPSIPSNGAMPVYNPSRQSSVVNILPYQLPSGTGNRELAYGMQSYLDGVPFKVANSLNPAALDVFQQLEFDSYRFLRQKAELLERLQYSFSLEKQVLKESES